MFEIIKMLIPYNSRTRPSKEKFKKTTITIHTTANPSSTARNERNWLVNPNNNRTASWHLCMDQKEIIEAIPEDEIAYHAGNATGNRYSIGLELCESGDFKVTEQKAINFLASELHKRGWGVDRIRTHQSWSGKNCPRLLLPTWNNFLQRIESKLNELKGESVGDSVRGIVTASVLNVRNQANTSGTIVGKLARNDSVIILETLSGWYKIMFNGKEAFASSDWINLTSGTPVQNTVQHTKINFSEIDRIELYGEGKRETMSQVFNKKKPDFIFNGMMYDTRSGISVADTIINKKFINGGNYTGLGIGVNRNKLFQSNLQTAIQLSKNNGLEHYIGAAPTLVWDKKKSMDNKGLTSGWLNTSAVRIGMGFNKDSLYFVYPKDRMTVSGLADEFIKLGVDTAINLDGGGSTHCGRKNASGNLEVINSPTENRANATWILVYLKEKASTPQPKPEIPKETEYEKLVRESREFVISKNISDGSNPKGNAIREEVFIMLKKLYDELNK